MSQSHPKKQQSRREKILVKRLCEILITGMAPAPLPLLSYSAQ
jgi:hypothetical protein